MRINDSNDVIGLGIELANKLHDYGIDIDNELTLKLNPTDFKKIDEDFYYRQNPNSNDFIPSDDEIVLNFNKLRLKILHE